MRSRGNCGDNRFHLRYLQVAVGQFHVQDHVPVLHQVEHLHHLRTVQPDAAFGQQEPGGGNLDAPEAPADEFLRLGQETGLAELAHPEHEEPLRIPQFHLLQVIVLQAVDELLGDDRGRHLRVIHVRQEHLGRVPAVDQEGRKHLDFRAHEQAPAVRERPDLLAVHDGFLPEPQVAVGVDDQHTVSGI